MTPEELKYYTALQPKFREAMGAWQAGDRYCCPNDNRDRKIKIIEDGYFDSMQYDSEGKLGAWINPEPCCPDIALRLPLPIDRDNPERGLLGMLQNFRYLSNKRIVSPSYLCSTGAVDDDPELNFGETPTIALLKALAAQEGVTP